MKICQKCRKQYSDENIFCEDCGQKLTDMKKKRSILVFVIPVGLFAAAVFVVLAYVFRDELPFVKKDAAQQETTWDSGGKPETEEYTTEEKETGEQQEEKQKEAAEEEEMYADAQINGVENVYVHVSGVVAQKNGSIILQMPESVSVCAYDKNEKVVGGTHVEYLLLAEDMEGYLGAQISVKGKLTADASGKFQLDASSLEVEKEAVREEDTDYLGHHYELILNDVTWSEAYVDCINRGGYLAQINSAEEYQYIIRLISEAAMQNVHFYLGGRRNADGSDYYWIDSQNEFVGESLNPEGDSWAAGYWMENEPSFISDNEEEWYMNLVYYQNAWVLNDVPPDITVYYPGKTGYICEHDN